MAFEAREELGEEDIMSVYSVPDKNIVEKLNYYEKVDELIRDLPKELSR